MHPHRTGIVECIFKVFSRPFSYTLYQGYPQDAHPLSQKSIRVLRPQFHAPLQQNLGRYVPVSNLARNTPRVDEQRFCATIVVRDVHQDNTQNFFSNSLSKCCSNTGSKRLS